MAKYRIYRFSFGGKEFQGDTQEDCAVGYGMEHWGDSYEESHNKYKAALVAWKEFFSRKDPDGTDRFVDIEVEDK
jgi:hypothetical protein